MQRSFSSQLLISVQITNELDEPYNLGFAPEGRLSFAFSQWSDERATDVWGGTERLDGGGNVREGRRKERDGCPQMEEASDEAVKGWKVREKDRGILSR